MRKFGTFETPSIIFVTLMFISPCAAQGTSKPADVAPIRRLAEMYMSGEADKLRAAFYSDARLFAIKENGELWIIPFSQYLENVTKNLAVATSRPLRTIDLIERTGNIATVKVTSILPKARVTDFLTMLEIAGEWKIVSKAFYVEKTVGVETATPSPDPSPLTVQANTGNDKSTKKLEE
ncbi:MAG TPA: nuclear transport factor 2 family protein [Pyrinomonadaceae bacterium]|nr:nuclear transport factor 2 family protein [Pyrinomonadaceae bacterium]